jgi:hypothetical protein
LSVKISDQAQLTLSPPLILPKAESLPAPPGSVLAAAASLCLCLSALPVSLSVSLAPCRLSLTRAGHRVPWLARWREHCIAAPAPGTCAHGSVPSRQPAQHTTTQDVQYNVASLLHTPWTVMWRQKASQRHPALPQVAVRPTCDRRMCWTSTHEAHKWRTAVTTWSGVVSRPLSSVAWQRGKALKP